MRCLGEEVAQQVVEEAHSGVCVVHINPGLSCVIASKEWDITGPLWRTIALTLQKGMMRASFTPTSFSDLQNHSIQL